MRERLIGLGEGPDVEVLSGRGGWGISENFRKLPTPRRNRLVVKVCLFVISVTGSGSVPIFEGMPEPAPSAAVVVPPGRKVVQIAAADEANRLYALCDDGTLWARLAESWTQIPAPPKG